MLTTRRAADYDLAFLTDLFLLHCGGERSISYEVSELLVYLFDLCARRVAYPIDEPESVEAKTTVACVKVRQDEQEPAR
jgi:hypothetical protein